MFSTNDLAEKTIVITGGTKGIGLETANLLANLGAKIVVGARNIEHIQNLHHGITVIELDVAKENSVKQFLTKTIELVGIPDVLVNCAGVGVFESFIDSTTENFDDMMMINLRGTYLCSKYFAREMLKKGNGQIINLVSIAGVVPLENCAGYAASKYGVLGLTKVMQAELRKKGIRVTAVIPGSVSSSFWDEIDPKPDMSQMIPPKVLAKHLVYIMNQPIEASIDEITIMPPLGIL